MKIDDKTPKIKINKKDKELNSFEMFSSGTYGCASYPRIDCKTGRKDKNNKTHISKLSANGFFTNNEFFIGKILKAIKLEDNLNDKEKDILDKLNYVEKKCNIEKKKLRIDESKHKCKVLKRNQTNLTLMQTKYIESQDIDSYLFDNFELKKLFRYYFFILNCLIFLHNHEIIHHDLHLGNTLIDRDDEFHLIDFGISLYVPNFFMGEESIFSNDDLNYKYLRKILLGFDPLWKYWPVEYHILCFFVYNRRPLTKNSLKSILDQYFKSSVAELFSHYFGNIEKYKKLCFAHLSKIYIDSKLSIEEYCVTILRNACYTWDIYQLNYNMLDIIKFYSLRNIDSLIHLLKQGLHYDYEKRNHSQYYKTEFIEILKQYKNAENRVYSKEKYDSKYNVKQLYESKKNEIEENDFSY